jgi:hypothetical protein
MIPRTLSDKILLPCTTQPANLDEDAGFQSIIIDVLSSTIMVWIIRNMAFESVRVYG